MTDTARFEAFVREFEDMVYGTAVRLLANPSEAEDIAQTVFLKAFERFEYDWGEPGGSGMAEDGRDQPLPQSPVALPLAVAILQRAAGGGNGRRGAERSDRPPAGAPKR